MDTMRPRLILPILVALITTALFGQQTDATSPADAVQISNTVILPNDAAALAVRASTTVAISRRNLADALDELGWNALRDDLSLSVSGSVSGTSLDDLSSGAGASVSFLVDLLPQLSLSAALRTSLSDPVPPQGNQLIGADIGLSFDPLAETGERDRKEIAADRAQLQLVVQTRKASALAISRLLDAVRKRDELPLLETSVSLAERELASTQALAARDRATEEQVESASDALRSARQSLERAQFNLSLSLNSLSQTLGIPVSADQLPGADELDVERRSAAALEERLAIDEDALAEDGEDVVSAKLDLRERTLDRSSARRFDPSINVGAGLSAGVAGSDAGTRTTGPEFELSFALTVRPSDWDPERVSRADEDILFAERALAAARTNAGFDLRSALLDFDQAAENLEAARHGLERAATDLAEAEFFLRRGEITQLQYDRTALSVAEAEADVRSAQISLIAQWTAIQLVQF
jgi:outer membrane protein TolC